jgi:hypothetical protein
MKQKQNALILFFAFAFDFGIEVKKDTFISQNNPLIGQCHTPHVN